MHQVHVVNLQLDVNMQEEESAHIVVTVHLPPYLPSVPIVCFAKPGGGYGRGYYTCDLPGPRSGSGSQAEWHAQRGWIFVSIDHLGVGDSSIHEGNKLTATVVSNANQAAEKEVLSRLAEGIFLEGYPKVVNPVKIGIGQSMGGCLTVMQQGRHHCFDGIAILGFSVLYTNLPGLPGEPSLLLPWRAQSLDPSHPHIILNHQAVIEAKSVSPVSYKLGSPMAWIFHHDDIPSEVLAEDMKRFGSIVGDTNTNTPVKVPPWGSLTSPRSTAETAITPGAVAPEAAAIRVPVLLAMGDRDVVADPKGEPRAYLSASSVDLYISPNMAHMHNFAGTRENLWRRLDIWSAWVCEMKAYNAK